MNSISSRPRRVVLGISGASGAWYAQRLLEQLLLAGVEVHLVVTDYGKRLLFDESGIKTIDLASLCPKLAKGAKASEISSKAKEDFALEKTRLVQNGKRKIQKDFDAKEKQIDVQRKM